MWFLVSQYGVFSLWEQFVCVMETFSVFGTIEAFSWLMGELLFWYVGNFLFEW
jgi:hypothetical protein